MNYVVVSNSEIRARAIYNLVKEFLSNSNGVFLVGDYDMDYLLYEDLDMLFFDKSYYYEYKGKFNKNLKPKKLFLVALEEESSDFDDFQKNINVICARTSMEKLMDLEKDSTKVAFTFADLSKRDLSILYLLSKGYTNKEIGSRLYLSEKTIKNNLTRIYKILGVTRKYQAISMFLKNFKTED